MNNRKELLKKLEKTLETALREGKYRVSAEAESEFIELLDKSLVGTESEACIDDINCIINQYMALADAFDLLMNKEK